MEILILEGIATSGKSTLAAGIREQLKGLNVRVATEAETHEPIMRQTGELHVQFFEKLIEKLVAEEPELIIFERLYLTQVFRAGAGLAEYATVENLLASYGTLTVFLRVDEQAIAERVTGAVRHRDPSWEEYVKTKGATPDEVAGYYIAQQRNQLKLLETSRLRHMVCDTTQHDYPEVTRQILEKLQVG